MFMPTLECFNDVSYDAHQSPAAPLVTVLEQLREVIDRLPNDQYVAKPVGPITSSIGAHVRHCLDHVRELLNASGRGELDYDRRVRGTDVETSRDAAAELIQEMQGYLSEMTTSDTRRPVSVSMVLSADEPPVIGRSSVGREIGFVLSHTIHHHALIGAMVKILGGWLPERFGYAPSTLTAQQRREVMPCAHSA